MITLMKKEGLSLPLIEVSGSEKGVNLLTAHGAKGLEFEHIFFTGCNAAFWEKKAKAVQWLQFSDTIFSGSGQLTEILKN
jgi:DNA helicase-2/ATP-dependent DNA helicase PcrA